MAEFSKHLGHICMLCFIMAQENKQDKKPCEDRINSKPLTQEKIPFRKSKLNKSSGFRKKIILNFRIYKIVPSIEPH